MLTRILGKSGLEVSAVGMGCWAIGGPWTWAQPGRDPYPAGWGNINDDESIRAIHAGLDAGVNFFDTAANYGAGHSEVVLGKALKGRRDQVIIATKFGHIVNEEAQTVFGDPDLIQSNLRMDIENSLRRLETDYIDIYQLHEGGYAPERAVELRNMLEELVDEGKIRWYGWSTDLVDRAEVFADGEHCTSIQFRLNVIEDNASMRQLCVDFSLAGINKDPLNKGILTGKFTTESKFPENDIRSSVSFQDDRIVRRLEMVEELRDVLTSGGRTMAQGAISYIWALDERMVPIPGFKSEAQVLDNAGAMRFGPLSTDELTQIQEIVSRYKEREET